MAIKKSGWLFVVIILAGFIIGTTIGESLSASKEFSLLSEGFEIGLTNPFTYSMGIFGLTFGFWLKMNVGGAIGIVLAALIFKAVF